MITPDARTADTCAVACAVHRGWCTASHAIVLRAPALCGAAILLRSNGAAERRARILGFLTVTHGPQGRRDTRGARLRCGRTPACSSRGWRAHAACARGRIHFSRTASTRARRRCDRHTRLRRPPGAPRAAGGTQRGAALRIPVAPPLRCSRRGAARTARFTGEATPCRVPAQGARMSELRGS